MTGVTANVRVMGGAGGNVALPSWDAVREHWPTAIKVTVAPLTVQTVDGLAVKVTGNPEEAVAETVNGDASSVRSGKTAKVIV
jgi:hypothetical protein